MGYLPLVTLKYNLETLLIAWYSNQSTEYKQFFFIFFNNNISFKGFISEVTDKTVNNDVISKTSKAPPLTVCSSFDVKFK